MLQPYINPAPQETLSMQQLDTLLSSGLQTNIGKIISFYKRLGTINDKLMVKKWLVEEINQGSNFLHWLAFLGEAALFEELVAEKLPFDRKDEKGNKPIHYASAQQKNDVLEVILKKDSQIPQNMGTLQMHQLSGSIYADGTKNLTPVAIVVSQNNQAALNLMVNYQKQAFRYYLSHEYKTAPNSPLIVDNFNWTNAVSNPDVSLLTSATGQIVSVNADGSVANRLCTGSYIGGQYFITAGHCIGQVCSRTNEAPGSYRVSFNYQYPSSTRENLPTGSINEKIYKIVYVEVHGQCHSVNEATDYAIFRLDISLSAATSLSSVPLSAQVPTVGENIIISEHPHGLPKKVARGAVSSGMDLNGKISYDAHTLRGSSGSPVIRATDTEQKVAAVHIEGDEQRQSFHRAITVKRMMDEAWRSDKRTLVENLLCHSILRDWQPPIEQPTPPQPKQQTNPQYQQRYGGNFY